MTLKAVLPLMTAVALSFILTSSEKKQFVKHNLIVLEAPPKVLTTEEVIKKTPLYYDAQRVEWILDEIEKELEKQNKEKLSNEISGRPTQDTARKVQSQVGDNNEQFSGDMGNRHIHSIQ